MAELTPHERQVFDRDGFIAYVCGNVPIAKKIAEKALGDIEANHRGFKDALKQADSEKLHYHAHALKDVSGLLRCDQLSICAKEIEALAKARMVQKVSGRAPEFALQIQRTTKALGEFTASKEAEGK